MSTDIVLYVSRPGEIQNLGRPRAGRISIGGINYRGQKHGSRDCLNIEVEGHPPDEPIVVSVNHVKQPVLLSWLSLNVTMRMQQQPHRTLGEVHVADMDMPVLGGESTGPRTWQWVLWPEDIERVDNDPVVPNSGTVSFEVEVDGLAKVIEVSSGRFLGDIWRLTGAAPQLTLEVAAWQRLIQSLGYAVPPSYQALADKPVIEHPSWGGAAKSLEQARTHYRRGEDDDTLRDCLSAFEALVSKPYSADQWKQRFSNLPEQKARGLSELFSGLATYCNTVGHHRSDADQAADGSFPTVPLDHWEADLILGASQCLLAYALRLTSS